jgi:hypothetical protein
LTASVEFLLEFYSDAMDRSGSCKTLSSKSGKNLLAKAYKLYDEKTVPIIKYYQNVVVKYRQVRISRDAEFEDTVDEVYALIRLSTSAIVVVDQLLPREAVGSDKVALHEMP